MKSILELPSEAKIRALLRRILLPSGLKCPHCCSFKVRAVERRYYCQRCRRKFSVKSLHPLLRHMRISYRQLYQLLWYWQHKYQPGQTAELTRLSAPTITRWYDRFRLYLPQLKDYLPLEGRIEVDESQFGHHYNWTAQWVAGAVASKDKQTRLQPIIARDSGNLDTFILNNTKEDTLIVTDGYSAYYGLENFHGRAHDIGNHSKGNFGPTSMAENIWSRCDRFIARVYQQVRKHRLPNLLVELQARFSKPELFQNPLSYLQFALSHVPLT